MGNAPWDLAHGRKPAPTSFLVLKGSQLFSCPLSLSTLPRSCNGDRNKIRGLAEMKGRKKGKRSLVLKARRFAEHISSLSTSQSGEVEGPLGEERAEVAAENKPLPPPLHLHNAFLMQKWGGRAGVPLLPFHIQ